MKNLTFLLLIIFGCSGCSTNPTSTTTTGKKILQVQETENLIIISKADKPVLHYQKNTVKPPYTAPDYYQRSGFIYPVYSPEGVVVSDDFPIGHAHQHSFYHAWTNTTFRGEKVDFWNQQHQLGNVRHQEVMDVFSTDSTAGFKIRLEHLSLKHGTVLQEDWTITAFDRSRYHLWEIAIDQQNVSSDTLFVNDYLYGGLGFRGSKRWNEDDTTAYLNPMKVLTSEGLSRDSANHSRPEWITAFAAVNDSLVGIAMLDHPDNFRFPQPIRVHPEMPYFCKAPMVGQAFHIAPGGTYQARYRMLVFDGPPDSQLIAAEQKRFSMH